MPVGCLLNLLCRAQSPCNLLEHQYHLGLFALFAGSTDPWRIQDSLLWLSACILLTAVPHGDTTDFFIQYKHVYTHTCSQIKI